MKNTSKKTGSNNAAATLANINAQIESLKQQRIGLAQPLKDRYAEIRGELLTMETQIRELDPSWKSVPLKPKAETKIAELITNHGSAMTPEEIIQAAGDLFTPWKIKNVLKKRSTGPKAFFAVNDGRYSLKAAA